LIDQYGWSSELQQRFHDFAAQGLTPGRVIVHQRGPYRIITDSGEMPAEMSGRLAHQAEQGGYPVAGDWVAVSIRQPENAATIHHVVPRLSAFVRKAAGTARTSQVVAANVDVAFLTLSLNDDMNLRRMERYLASTRESGAEPQIILTKADLTADAAALKASVQEAAKGVTVHLVSAVTGEGLDSVVQAIGRGRTAVLLGSSGVGKSTLVNALVGSQVMATRAIREDDAKGRHTTTHRELVLLPGGGLLLDTPGMRELGLWDAEAGVAETFADVEELAAQCRFSDCKHGNEPGCAIRTAIGDGTLDEGRWRSFMKLQGELAHLDRKDNPKARAATRKVHIARHKAYRALVRLRDQDD
jgi:ribosome biogenesis GTPase